MQECTGRRCLREQDLTGPHDIEPDPTALDVAGSQQFVRTRRCNQNRIAPMAGHELLRGAVNIELIGHDEDVPDSG